MHTLQPVHVRHVHNTVGFFALRLIMPLILMLLFVVPHVSTPFLPSSISFDTGTSFTADQTSNSESVSHPAGQAPVGAAQNTQRTQTITGIASLRSWTSEEIGVGTTPNVARLTTTATTLRNGRILIAGGYGSAPGPVTDPASATAELYAPETGTFTMTGGLVQPRFSHTATLLDDGRVLLAGGFQDFHLQSAEIYDPETGTFTATGNMTVARSRHTATLLLNGKVLIVGGEYNGDFFTTSAELYDPATGTFSSTGSLPWKREGHTATLLENGRVLVAGGSDTSRAAVLYAPTTGNWTETGTPINIRRAHTATLLDNGHVLLIGGSTSSDSSSVTHRSAELYNPATGRFTATGSMRQSRLGHTATLLPNGNIAVIGGFDGNSEVAATAEIYNSMQGAFTAGGIMLRERYQHEAVLLPSGKVLILGATFNEQGKLDAAIGAEIYDPMTRTSSTTSRKIDGRRLGHTATRLPNGTVLIAGGYDSVIGIYSAPLIYEPTTSTFMPSGAMRQARRDHTATLLRDGTVLITGGLHGTEPVASAEIYNPTRGTFTTVASMVEPRFNHRATMLQDGRILITGGTNVEGGSIGGLLRSAELYNPATGRFTAAGQMQTIRQGHTATLLPDGTVLIVGLSNSVELNTAELYFPATRTFSMTAAMEQMRGNHSATLLQDGTVFITGGSTGALDPLASTEVYNPVQRTFTRGASLLRGRSGHEATTMDDGIVLVSGGSPGSNTSPMTPDIEVYDSNTHSIMAAGTTISKPSNHSATRLNDDSVLIVGGEKPIAELGELRIENTFMGALTLPTGWVSTATPTITVTGSTTGTRLIDGSVNDGPWFRLRFGVAVETTVSALEDGADQPVVLRLRDATGSAIVVVRGSIDIDTPRSRVFLPIVLR